MVNKELEKQKLHSIEYGNTDELPKEIKEIFNLENGKIYIAKEYGQAHEEGLKSSIETAAFEVLNDKLYLKRDNKFYGHQKEEKVFYIEDIENIIKENKKELINKIFNSINNKMSIRRINTSEFIFDDIDLKCLKEEFEVKE